MTDRGASPPAGLMVITRPRRFVSAALTGAPSRVVVFTGILTPGQIAAGAKSEHAPLRRLTRLLRGIPMDMEIGIVMRPVVMVPLTEVVRFAKTPKVPDRVRQTIGMVALTTGSAPVELPQRRRPPVMLSLMVGRSWAVDGGVVAAMIATHANTKRVVEE